MTDSRKRQRSPPLASSMVTAQDDDSIQVRRGEEWEKAEGGSLLLLPPTAALIKSLVHMRTGEVRTWVVKVAAFDMDDTLIKPASGGVFAKDDAADWQWVHPNVCGHLQHMYAQGFLVVLFSNQLGIGKGSSWNTEKAGAVMDKIIQLSSVLGIPLCACVATKADAWRKPSPQMWSLMLARVENCLRGVFGESSVLSSRDCISYSFYVGDAAGRSVTTLAGRKKDFNGSDRQFAFNARLPFLTPEQFFLCPVSRLCQADELCHRGGPLSSMSPSPTSVSIRLSDSLLHLTHTSLSSSSDNFSWGDVSPDELQQLPRQYAGLSTRVITQTTAHTIVLPSESPFFARPRVQEMVIFVGYPGCGKSSLFFRHFKPFGYMHINRDTMGSRGKCLKKAEEYWASGSSVVIDNSNPTAGDRQAFIDIVQRVPSPKRMEIASAHDESGVLTLSSLPVRIFVFMHSRGMASHMNHVRAQVQGVPRVPPIAYNIYQSRFERPTTPAEVAVLRVDSVWEVPIVACFDGAPSQTEQVFFSQLF